MAELLTLVYVRDMHLYHRTFQRADAVVQRNAGMCISPCIQHDAVAGEAHLLHLVDQFALHIALIVIYLNVRVSLLQFRQEYFERLTTIDAWFAHAQQVQVWPIDNLNFHLLLVYWLQSYEKTRAEQNKFIYFLCRV